MNSLNDEYIHIYKQYKIQTLFDKIQMHTNITYNYEELCYLLNYFDYKYNMVSSKDIFIYYNNSIPLYSLYPKNLLYASQIINNFTEVNKIRIEDSELILYDYITSS